MIHYDLWLWEGEIFARPVNVKASSSNPILTVDFDGSQATAQRPLILTEDHISVTNASHGLVSDHGGRERHAARAGLDVGLMG